MDGMTHSTLETLRRRMERRFRDLEIAEDRCLNATALERLYQAYLVAFAEYKAALNRAKTHVPGRRS